MLPDTSIRTTAAIPSRGVVSAASVGGSSARSTRSVSGSDCLASRSLMQARITTIAVTMATNQNVITAVTVAGSSSANPQNIGGAMPFDDFVLGIRIGIDTVIQVDDLDSDAEVVDTADCLQLRDSCVPRSGRVLHPAHTAMAPMTAAGLSDRTKSDTCGWYTCVVAW